MATEEPHRASGHLYALPVAAPRLSSLPGEPDTNGEANGDDPAVFTFSVVDVFQVSGRGTAAVGRVETGSIAVGTTVSIRREGKEVGRATVAGVISGKSEVGSATAGARVGLVLGSLERDSVRRGDSIHCS